MYAKIKELADEAIALQNKNRMDEVLRYISEICAPNAVMLVDGQYRTEVPPPADPAAVLAAAQPGDTVQVTGIENTETGESKMLDVKVTSAARGKKGGAK